MEIFKVDNLMKTFQNGEVEEQVLKGIDLTLNEGEVTALVGASGSGKSTLLTIAAGLRPATDGKIMFDGDNLSTMQQDEVRKIRAEQYGFIFESSHPVHFLNVEYQHILTLAFSGSNM